MSQCVKANIFNGMGSPTLYYTLCTIQHTVCVLWDELQRPLHYMYYTLYYMHWVLYSVSRRIMGWPAKTAITSLCSPSPAALVGSFSLVGVFAKDFLAREVFVKDFSDRQIWYEQLLFSSVHPQQRDLVFSNPKILPFSSKSPNHIKEGSFMFTARQSGGFNYFRFKIPVLRIDYLRQIGFRRRFKIPAALIAFCLSSGVQFSP